MSLTKKTKLKLETFFFISDRKTCHTFWGFEQLSSTIFGANIRKQKHIQTAAF